MNGVIFQCASCRALVAIHDVQLHEDRAGLACSVCASVTWLPKADAARASTSSARATDGVTVTIAPPKELPPVTALAPTRNTAAWTDAQTSRVTDRLAQLRGVTDAQRELADAFDGVLGRWGDEGAHKTLLKRASLANELAFVGQRYRAVLDAVPDDAQAKRAQSEILSIAMVTMVQHKDIGSLDADKNERKKRVAAAVLVVASLLFLGIALARMVRVLQEDEVGGMIEQPPEAPR